MEKEEDEWTIKEWRTTSEPRVIYIKPEDVPVCFVKKRLVETIGRLPDTIWTG